MESGSIVNYGVESEPLSRMMGDSLDGLSFVGSETPSHHLRINEALLCLISGESKDQLSSLIVLNLHIRDSRYPKIKEITNLHLVSNLRVLNLSYNAIEKIEAWICVSG